MKVKMTAQISGLRDGKPWPGVDEVVDLPDDEGATVVASGMAVADDTPAKGAKAKPETATAKSDAETR